MSCYLRFLSAQKLTKPITQDTATTAIIATSVVMNGASDTSVVVGSVGSDVVGAGVADSGSKNCAADGASVTLT